MPPCPLANLCRAAACFGMPKLIHLAVAAVLCTITIAMNFILSLADMSPSPISKQWLAQVRAARPPLRRARGACLAHTGLASMIGA